VRHDNRNDHTIAAHYLFGATPIEQWEAARRYFYTASSAEAWLTVFAVAALIILVILLFWLSAKRRNSELRLKSNRSSDHADVDDTDDTDDSESGNGADNHNATGSWDGDRSNKSSKEGASPAEMLVLIAQAEEKLSKAREKSKD
jgi:FtsZ-interacting cell division protein ZipA